MEQSTTTSFHLGNHRSVALECGMINASDDSKDRLHIYAGIDVLNDAVAAYLPRCDRSTQERFMQILTDHIRKIENANAEA